MVRLSCKKQIIRCRRWGGLNERWGSRKYQVRNDETKYKGLPLPPPSVEETLNQLIDLRHWM